MKITNSVAHQISPVETLSLRERNTMRYMEEYVMMKLKNKVVKKRSAASELHNKYKWFVDVLDSLKVYILWMLLQCRAT